MSESTQPVLVDEVYIWLESNPRQLQTALSMVYPGEGFVHDILAELKDWLAQLLTQGSHWAFPPLLYAELMSLSCLRRRVDLAEEPLSDGDVLILYSRLLKLTEVPR